MVEEWCQIDAVSPTRLKNSPIVAAPDSGGSQLHIELGLLADLPCPSHKSSD